ncbi:MAG TPA: SDR family oxidoreductase [Sphingomicrobium sp.]|nr:SDR family oxidoreductase [Sphingomicrobium sp.]
MGQQPTRTAIVTGAAKRVGRAIADALLADGWAVVAHVHQDGDSVTDGAVAVAADLAEKGAAEVIFAAAEGLPPVELLVNNAARFAEDRLESISAATFDSHMAINVRAPALLTQMFAERVGDSGGGLVVNLLDAKLSALNPDYLSYTLSKIALAGLTELSARALAGQGIRVNGIAPALMLRSEGQDESNFEAMHRFNPLGRGVAPADVVAALRYLIDATAMTGEILTLDGGQRFWALPRDVQFLEKK